MRAEEVIATHGNTDFDAFAAMLAARRLYPNAVVCLAGSLNRNVREFYRLHADELRAVDASRLELDAIRRLIVVETLLWDRGVDIYAHPTAQQFISEHLSAVAPRVNSRSLHVRAEQSAEALQVARR